MKPAEILQILSQRRAIGFTRFIIQRMYALNMTQVAASLTFTTLLAIIPLLTVTLIVISAFPVFADFNERFKSILLGTLVPEFASKIDVYLNQFMSNVGNLTSIGLIALGVTVLMLLRTIEQAFNAIWRGHTPRSLPQQLLVYWTVLTLGPLLLGAGLSIWRLFYTSFGTPDDWPLLARVLEGFSSLMFTAMILWLYTDRAESQRSGAPCAGRLAVHSAGHVRSPVTALVITSARWPPINWCTAHLPACR